MMNLTRSNNPNLAPFQLEDPAEEEEDLSKPMRKFKPNPQNVGSEIVDIVPCSPSKVDSIIQIPFRDRRYGLRNREDIKNKTVF